MPRSKNAAAKQKRPGTGPGRIAALSCGVPVVFDAGRRPAL